MPRYFFHVFDGRSEPDRDGTELPDLGAARQTALRYAGEILNDQAHQSALGENWRLEVADAQGAIVFRCDFRVTDVSIDREADPGDGAVRRGATGSKRLAATNPGHVRD